MNEQGVGKKEGIVMRILVKIGIVLAFLFTASFMTGLQPAFTGTINVPTGGSIQAGIDAASNGDTVLVAPGTYPGINFNGKSIKVKSSGGASVTIIDGSSSGSVVTFSNYESKYAVLDSFTIQNGSGTLNEGDDNTYGGGIFCYNSSPRIINNTIKKNNAYRGGGILCEGDSAFPEIYNNTIVENTGGGIYCKDFAIPTITNNIIANNTNTDTFGGAVLADFIFPEDEVNYNDAWNNTSPQYYIEYEETPPTSPGVKNIKADPLFVDATGGDYHLQNTSPCIDAGTKINAPTKDFEGETRPFNGTADIGADEFVGTSSNTCSCEGATGCISGRVTKKRTGSPIQGKTVLFKKRGVPAQMTTTNTNGCYFSPTLENGTYTVKVKGCKGAGARKSPVVISDTNKTVDDFDFQCK